MINEQLQRNERKHAMARNDNVNAQRFIGVDERLAAGRPANHEGRGSFSEEPARYGPGVEARNEVSGAGSAPMSQAKGQWEGNELVVSYRERPEAEPYTREDYIEATEHLYAWRSAWLRAIGLAWSD